MNKKYLITLTLLTFMLSACGKTPFEEKFMEGCPEGRNSEKVCQCTLDSLENIYGMDKLNEYLESKRVPASMDTDIVKSAMFCRHKYDEE